MFIGSDFLYTTVLLTRDKEKSGKPKEMWRFGKKKWLDSTFPVHDHDYFSEQKTSNFQIFIKQNTMYTWLYETRRIYFAVRVIKNFKVKGESKTKWLHKAKWKTAKL